MTSDSSGGTTYVVVPTHDRPVLLRRCLSAIESQEQTPTGVVIVDNASTDGAVRAVVEDFAKTTQLDVGLLRLARNGGSAEGFHAGAKEALRRDADWIWFLDDDAEPCPQALGALLSSRAAIAASTILVRPVVVTPDGQVQRHHAGTLRRRLLGTLYEPLIPAAYEEGEHRIGFASYLGLLVRGWGLVASGLPLREYFVGMDDIELTTRLAGLGDAWMVASARVIHNDGKGPVPVGVTARARAFLEPIPFASMPKEVYSLRNNLAFGRAHGYVGRGSAILRVGWCCCRALLRGEHRMRQARLFVLYGRDGWTGTFRNVPSHLFQNLATVRRPARYIAEHALSYTFDVESETVLGCPRR